MAARELQLYFLEKQFKLTLQYIQAIAAQHEVDAQDLIEIMQCCDQQSRGVATEDTATIEQALQPYEECPWNSEINELFNSTPELHLILDSNSFERIRNKVKNLMRKKTKRPKH